MPHQTDYVVFAESSLPAAGEKDERMDAPRTDDEASLNIEQVCAAMKNRGGFTGNYDDLVGNVKQFFDEAAYQLCDGYSVNTGYYSLHPRVGGTFDAVREGIDEKKHPMTFTFRTCNPLRELAKHIEIFVEGVADVQGYIDEVLDVTTGAVNKTLTPGGMVVITGSRIKVVGDKPGIGIVLTGTRAGSMPYNQQFSDKYAENDPSKVIAVLPPTIPGDGQFVIKITTQYSAGGHALERAARRVERDFCDGLGGIIQSGLDGQSSLDWMRNPVWIG